MVGKDSVTPRQCAHEVADHVYAAALSNKELKSLAASIGYKVGFFSPSRTVRLRYELGCLYAFVGSLLLEICSKEFPHIPRETIEETKRLYVAKLLRWLPDHRYSEYERRLKVWEPLFSDLDDPGTYAVAPFGLAKSFYQFLTQGSCDEGIQAMLVLRFNSYLRNFLGTFQQYVGDIHT